MQGDHYDVTLDFAHCGLELRRVYSLYAYFTTAKAESGGQWNIKTSLSTKSSPPTELSPLLTEHLVDYLLPTHSWNVPWYCSFPAAELDQRYLSLCLQQNVGRGGARSPDTLGHPVFAIRSIAAHGWRQECGCKCTAAPSSVVKKCGSSSSKSLQHIRSHPTAISHFSVSRVFAFIQTGISSNRAAAKVIYQYPSCSTLMDNIVCHAPIAVVVILCQ